MPRGVYDHSHIKFWQTGKTKNTDERLRQIGMKVSAKLKGHEKSVDHKEHIRAGVKQAWNEPLYRKNHENGIRRYHATSEYRENASIGLTSAHADPNKFLSLPLNEPLVCYYCAQEIDQAGIHSESVVFHSLDGNHENWDPANKVPVHRKCHPRAHKEERKTRRSAD